MSRRRSGRAVGSGDKWRSAAGNTSNSLTARRIREEEQKKTRDCALSGTLKRDILTNSLKVPVKVNIIRLRVPQKHTPRLALVDLASSLPPRSPVFPCMTKSLSPLAMCIVNRKKYIIGCILRLLLLQLNHGGDSGME